MYIKAFMLISHVVLWRAGCSNSFGLGITQEDGDEPELSVRKRFYNCSGIPFEDKHNILEFPFINGHDQYGCTCMIKPADSLYRCKDKIFADKYKLLSKNVSLCPKREMDCWYFLGNDTTLVIIKFDNQYSCYTGSMNSIWTLEEQNLQLCREIESIFFSERGNVGNLDVFSYKEAKLQSNASLLNIDHTKFHSRKQNTSLIENIDKTGQYTCHNIQFQDKKFILDESILACMYNNYECWYYVNNSFSQIIIKCNNTYFCYKATYYEETWRLEGSCNLNNLEVKHEFQQIKNGINHLIIICMNQTYCYFTEQSNWRWTLISKDINGCNEHHRRPRSETLEITNNKTAPNTESLAVETIMETNTTYTPDNNTPNDPCKSTIIETSTMYSEKKEENTKYQPAEQNDYFQCDSKKFHVNKNYEGTFTEDCKLPMKSLECNVKYENGKTYVNIRCGRHYYVFIANHNVLELVSAERWEMDNMRYNRNARGILETFACQDKSVFGDKSVLTDNTLTCINNKKYVCTYYIAESNVAPRSLDQRSMFDNFHGMNPSYHPPNDSPGIIQSTLDMIRGMIDIHFYKKKGKIKKTEEKAKENELYKDYKMQKRRTQHMVGIHRSNAADSKQIIGKSLVEDKALPEVSPQPRVSAEEIRPRYSILASDVNLQDNTVIIGCNNTYWCFVAKTDKKASTMTIYKSERLIYCLKVVEWEWEGNNGLTFYGKIIFATVGVILCCSSLALFILVAILMSIIHIAQL